MRGLLGVKTMILISSGDVNQDLTTLMTLTQAMQSIRVLTDRFRDLEIGVGGLEVAEVNN